MRTWTDLSGITNKFVILDEDKQKIGIESNLVSIQNGKINLLLIN